MPELPEVETMVRGIRPHLEGATLTGVALAPCDCRPISISPSMESIGERTAGQLVTRVWRRAKRVVITLASEESFIIEPRMTGLMLVADPPDQAHLRIEWRFQRGRKCGRVWFWDRRGLGTMKLVDADGLDGELGSHKLGPDALEMNRRLWQKKLQLTQRPVKVALLDQKLVAGIGNLYASEILHRAGIHPVAPAATLTLRQVARLSEAVDSVLNTAIEHEGSTLSDGTYRNALNKFGGYQNSHQVYDRADETCLTCRKGTIQRIVQAQRSTFFCPRCQRI